MEEWPPPPPSCPSCKSLKVHRSRERGRIDKIMKFFKRRPMRCDDCRRRFYLRRDRS